MDWVDHQNPTLDSLLTEGEAVFDDNDAAVDSNVGKIRRAKEHWTLQTESLRISSLEYFFERDRQFLTLSELQTGPSLVQTQVTQGDVWVDFPLSINFLLMRHLDPLSIQWVRSIPGRLLQGTRGFKKGSGRSMAIL